MPHRDAAAMLRALAQGDALRVFAAVVTATGTGSPQRSGGSVSLHYITLAGVSGRTGLPEAAVVSALTELMQAHLIVANRDGDGWCTDFHALRRVADGLVESDA